MNDSDRPPYWLVSRGNKSLHYRPGNRNVKVEKISKKVQLVGFLVALLWDSFLSIINNCSMQKSFHGVYRCMI